MFLLYDSTFSQDTTTPSQACIDARMELLANRACYQAIIKVARGLISVCLHYRSIARQLVEIPLLE